MGSYQEIYPEHWLRNKLARLSMRDDYLLAAD